jgi:hypothetical protein
MSVHKLPLFIELSKTPPSKFAHKGNPLEDFAASTEQYETFWAIDRRKARTFTRKYYVNGEIRRKGLES